MIWTHQDVKSRCFDRFLHFLSRKMDDGQGTNSLPPQGRDIGPDEIYIGRPQENGSQDRYRPVEMVRNVQSGNYLEGMDMEYETVYVENRNHAPVDGEVQLEVIVDPASRAAARVPAVPLYSEKKRLDTFKGKWLTSYHVTASDLARNGFYYLGPHDKVKCIFCMRTLRGWDPGDNVEEEHRRHYPNCPFVKGETVDQNIPMNYTEDLKKNMHVKVKTDEINLPGAKHEEYSGFDERLKTFDTWQYDDVVNRYKLAEAGFFYSGKRDTCRCHYCGKLIGKWEHGDDPVEEHYKWYPECLFNQAMKVKIQNSQNRGAEEIQVGGYVANNPSNSGLTNGQHTPTIEPVQTPSVEPTAPPQELVQCTEPSQSLLERDLQSAAVAAVLELEEMSMEQLTKVLQCLRLTRGPDATISAADILCFDEDME